MDTMEILDVTVIEPRLKHPTIFKHFDGIGPGGGFTILNDHDPKPLYYELLAERGNIFQWEYLEKGPETWRVRISKPAGNGATSETIGAIVAKDMRKAEIFKKRGIDFCCGGKKKLKDVCAEKNIDFNQLQSELDSLDQQKDPTAPNYQNWKAGFLADYIVEQHHTYVSEAIPTILEVANKVVNRHAKEHPDLRDIQLRFKMLSNELVMHMQKEEQVLFPFIKEMEQALGNQLPVKTPPFDSVDSPIRMMENEHEEAGKLMEKLRMLTNNYTPPEGACNSFRFLYHMLEQFENDLHQHIHLENNILFPKAKELEQKTIQNSTK